MKSNVDGGGDLQGRPCVLARNHPESKKAGPDFRSLPAPFTKSTSSIGASRFRRLDIDFIPLYCRLPTGF